MYRTLEPVKIVQSLETLERRIGERFPTAGLAQVCAELTTIAREHTAIASRIGRPNMLLRASVLALIAACLLLLVKVAGLIDFSKTSADNVYTVLQGIEATMNILVLMGAAVLFLTTFEERLKRRRALAALNELRSIAHVIDMHQLTKDPSSVAGTGPATASSPSRTMTPFLLSRYLDYCSEMLSLTAKVAALYAQSFPDPVVGNAVNDLEQVTTNLSQKIWQKINIVQAIVANMPIASVPEVRSRSMAMNDGKADLDAHGGTE